mmetsp:Transcript_108226/g.345056  ORF Transcript_108226/g.345056 Transcript_108226/m.345056 type:complete len:809 (+) Transcript_108226:81-2507(+)
MTRLAAILGLTLACDGSASGAKRSRAPRVGPDSYYVLAQQWLPEACLSAAAASRACTSPQPLWGQDSVLQSLRLHGPNHTVYEECPGTPLSLEDLSSATRSSLSQLWPEVVDGLSWSAVWQQYGTCTELDAPHYFEQALLMHGKVGTPQLLGRSVGQLTSAGEVLAAYGGAGEAVLVCHGGLDLLAVYTCWSGGGNGSTRARVECPRALRDSSDCGPKVFVRGFQRSSGQSQFATAVWLVQYTVLLCRFLGSWWGDCCAQQNPAVQRSTCRSLRSCCVFTRRTPIQFLAIVHAGTGVFSQLWAILADTAGETGLAMWPVLSVLELASNLAISVLMLFWYSLVCSSLGRAPVRLAYCSAFLCTAVVLVWSALYLAVNLQRKSAQDMKQREMDPIHWVSFCYYLVNAALDLLCMAAVCVLQDELSRTEGLRPTIQWVFNINMISVLDAVAMVVVHVEKVQQVLSVFLEGWHSWTMGALFCIRYVTVSLLIEPVSQCEDRHQSEIRNALHFGPLLSYNFERGSALVICNSTYGEGSRYGQLGNREDAFRYATALQRIGFHVDGPRFNLSADEMFRVVEEWAGRSQEEKADGVAFAYSGHGNPDTVVGVDGAEVSIPQLMGLCRSGEPLVPKLFFWDCCRGISSESRRPRRNQLSFEVLLRCSPRGPSAMADCLACYATAEGFENGGEGVFTRRLCNRIEELAESGDHDIEDALKLAGAEVSQMPLGFCRSRRQCPTYESSLTRRFVIRSVRGHSSSNLTGSTAASATDLAGSSSEALLPYPQSPGGAGGQGTGSPGMDESSFGTGHRPGGA